MTDNLLPQAIERQHKATIEKVHEYLDRMVQGNGLHQSLMAEDIVGYSLQLFRLLPKESVPNWLEHLVTNFSNANLDQSYSTNNATEFAQFILVNYARIIEPILLGDDLLYDFDAAYATIRDEENIPETFDKLVELLEQIIALDLVESRTVQDALDRLRSLLRRNRRGSLASILVTFHYGNFFLKGFEGALSTVPQLKPIVEAFKKEFKIAEDKVKHTQQILKRTAASRLTNEERLTVYLAQTGVERNSIAGYLEEAASNTETA